MRPLPFFKPPSQIEVCITREERKHTPAQYSHTTGTAPAARTGRTKELNQKRGPKRKRKKKFPKEKKKDSSSLLKLLPGENINKTKSQ